MLDEQQGAKVLRQVFEARGFTITPEYSLPTLEAGLPDVVLDGFDPVSRVGYEWITEEAGDRRAFGPGVVTALEAAVAAGTLHLLLVDEADVGDEASLTRIGHRFLDRLAHEGRTP